MSRDGFSKAVIDRLAKRVGMKCSHPDCRQPTSGPDSNQGTTNTGVAAHIAGASPGGARYDEAMTPEQRSDIGNGIWLCQKHAKLIDDDEISFPATILHGWKETAELMARLEALGYAVMKAKPFSSLEQKAPKLIAEMRDDLRQKPLVREFILMKRGWCYNGDLSETFTYFTDDYDYLQSMMAVMQHLGAIYDRTYNSVPRYSFTEEFVSFLIGE